MVVQKAKNGDFDEDDSVIAGVRAMKLEESAVPAEVRSDDHTPYLPDWAPANRDQLTAEGPMQICHRRPDSGSFPPQDCSSRTPIGTKLVRHKTFELGVSNPQCTCRVALHRFSERNSAIERSRTIYLANRYGPPR